MNTVLNFLFNHTPLFYLTQSLWRDEAFSYFMAKPSIVEIITNCARDFNPPLYYILLHLWMQMVGKSDIGLRVLSFVFFAAAVYMTYMLATVLFTRRFALFTAALMFFNPMLLYYAFELRMYALYVFFVVASLYSFVTKRWKLYTLTTALGLYTHSFFILLPLSLLAYTALTHRDRKNSIELTRPFIFFLPWIPVLAVQFSNSQQSWLYPVDLQGILSTLGNLFTGYEGTPDRLWSPTAILSAIIGLFLIRALWYRKTDAKIYITAIVLPLALILGYSLLRRPLFVNRYMIFVTVLEVIGVCLAIASIRSKVVRRATAAVWLLFCLGLNVFSVQFHRKTDFKATFAEINTIAKPSDYVYTKTPIGYLESAYYYRTAEQVFIYNPQNIPIPNYIGVSVLFPDVLRAAFPPAPSTTYLVADDASYEVILQQ